MKSILWILGSLVVGLGIGYIMGANNVTFNGGLSDVDARRLALNVIAEDLNDRTRPECLSLDSQREGDFVIYEITKKFNDTCYPNPVDYTSVPQISNIKIDLKTKEVFIASIDGEFRLR